jgi:rhodanese-related sulfurtransferase
MVSDVTVLELARELVSENPPKLLDVRETFERQISCLDDDLHIPMGSIPSSLEKISKEDPIVVYCRSGSRSSRVVEYLRSLGYSKARNLVGGINAWASEVDASLPTY